MVEPCENPGCREKFNLLRWYPYFESPTDMSGTLLWDLVYEFCLSEIKLLV